MKVSELWLKDWVDYQLTGEKLASQLTMAGLEVDALSPVAGAFHNVVVAHVLETKQHPQADRLTLCTVDAGDGKHYQVVCGAFNVRANLKVAMAKIGAMLPNGLVIKETKLRGELSEGMLCSASELGMTEESEGILELEEDAPIGTSLRTYLLLDDSTLDIDLTPNRADCLSIVGVAREISAMNQLPMKPMPTVKNTPTITETLSIQIDNPIACPNYCGRIIRNINLNALTPFWMVERLRRSGIRSINPVVDVLNYVMLEFGQPMHAFDLNTISGGINVRIAEDKEPLTLLDGNEVRLHEKVLVIADKEKVLAMAGIMGGEISAVSDTTKDIFLESAFFNPLTVAGIARQFGLVTDASQRYERGVDPKLPMFALERATDILHSIVGGEIGPVTEVLRADKMPVNPHVPLTIANVARLTGVEINKTDILAILQGLNMSVEEKSDSLFSVKAPSYRFDIHQEEDVIEEIIRIYGYDNIQSTQASGFIQVGEANVNESLSSRLTTWFSHRGYHETISYSFVDDALQQALYPDSESMQLKNPISSELSDMRIGLWPGLVAAMVHNLHRQHEAIKLFESGVVFKVNQGELTEEARIAGLLTGEFGGSNWCETAKIADFYDLKGDLEALFATLKVSDITFVQSTHEALHPGQAACIMRGQEVLGFAGVLHPRLSQSLDCVHPVLVFELSLQVLNKQSIVSYQPISKYPHIRRDLSFIVDEKVSAGAIEAGVKSLVLNDWLKAFDVFDVYTGPGVDTGKKSVAISLVLQDNSRTLVDSEINQLIGAIINKLEREFFITLRD